ncbi:MAG: carbon-nitrogen hydrolase [Thioalkalispiraceae bacterium]
MKISAVQHACSDDRNSNLQRSIAGIEEAAKHGAQLVCLQELHTSLYFCQEEHTSNFDLAESIPGESTQALQQVAQECQVVIVASLFEHRASGLYHNTAVVIDKDGKLAGRYRKMHIPDDPGYYEKFYFTPGDLGFTPVQTAIGKLGVLVCWDQWFPEAARLMTLAGADLLMYPTAIGWDPQDDKQEQQRQQQAWQTVQRAHAIANGIPVVACNRVGFEQHPENKQTGIEFWGSSFICGPQGEILAQADQNRAETIVAAIDMQRVESVRRIWPFLRDRRIDAYQDIGQRYLDSYFDTEQK